MTQNQYSPRLCPQAGCQSPAWRPKWLVHLCFNQCSTASPGSFPRPHTLRIHSGELAAVNVSKRPITAWAVDWETQRGTGKCPALAYSGPVCPIMSIWCVSHHMQQCSVLPFPAVPRRLLFITIQCLLADGLYPILFWGVFPILFCSTVITSCLPSFYYLLSSDNMSCLVMRHVLSCLSFFHLVLSCPDEAWPSVRLVLSCPIQSSPTWSSSLLFFPIQS